MTSAKLVSFMWRNIMMLLRSSAVGLTPCSGRQCLGLYRGPTQRWPRQNQCCRSGVTPTTSDQRTGRRHVTVRRRK
uniref:Putative isocitrate dehydrogenase alpha subunit n=1 Tax=Ixodes ricinus TaxID=34613 RepID=A0A0K8RM21_IXORI